MIYIKRKISKGQTPKDRLEWKQASEYWTKESPVARGNNFNKTVREADIYDYHEIFLENGKRLDSYDPDAGEIISRKATDLDTTLCNLHFQIMEHKRPMLRYPDFSQYL